MTTAGVWDAIFAAVAVLSEAGAFMEVPLAMVRMRRVDADVCCQWWDGGGWRMWVGCSESGTADARQGRGGADQRDGGEALDTRARA